MVALRKRARKRYLAASALALIASSLLPTHIGAIRKRFIVRADEKLTAFVELELAIRAEGNCA
ncbi:MAG: hypothetical protein DME81_10300 [Verrucomicrobia bacterium]|nr:MAG: hypothetical protein DME81_10300 [Verrucomicrobiota bacterium]